MLLSVSLSFFGRPRGGLHLNKKGKGVREAVKGGGEAQKGGILPNAGAAGPIKLRHRAKNSAEEEKCFVGALNVLGRRIPGPSAPNRVM